MLSIYGLHIIPKKYLRPSFIATSLQTIMRSHATVDLGEHLGNPTMTCFPDASCSMRSNSTNRNEEGYKKWDMMCSVVVGGIPTASILLIKPPMPGWLEDGQWTMKTAKIKEPE